MRATCFAAIFALSLAALPLAASAQGGSTGMAPLGGPGGGMGGGMGAGRGMMRGGAGLYDPAALPALKHQLGITAQQEPQWKAYCGAITNAWETRQAQRRSMLQSPPQTVQEREQMRASHREVGLQLHNEVLSARSALAAVLTPEQRTAFDQAAPAFQPRMAPPR